MLKWDVVRERAGMIAIISQHCYSLTDRCKAPYNGPGTFFDIMEKSFCCNLRFPHWLSIPDRSRVETYIRGNSYSKGARDRPWLNPHRRRWPREEEISDVNAAGKVLFRLATATS